MRDSDYLYRQLVMKQMAGEESRATGHLPTVHRKEIPHAWRIAARRIGCSVESYVQNRLLGLRWCGKEGKWVKPQVTELQQQRAAAFYNGEVKMRPPGRRRVLPPVDAAPEAIVDPGPAGEAVAPSAGDLALEAAMKATAEALGPAEGLKARSRR